jgi:hypothetical protein
MRLSNLVSLAVVAPASIAILAPTVSATTIFNQNFDDTSIFPTDVGISATGSGVAPEGRWAQNASTTPTPTPRVDPAPAYAGDQAMQMRRNGGGVTGLLGYLSDDSITLPTSGTFYFQYSVYRTDANTSFTANVENSTLINSNYPVGIYVAPDGTLEASYSTDNGYAPRPSADPFVVQQGVWTTLRYVVNQDAGTWDLFASDNNGEVQILSNYPYATAHLGAVNEVAFTPSGDVGNTFYVDDVYLSTDPKPVPEPVTGALAVAGGALLLLRRRHS